MKQNQNRSLRIGSIVKRKEESGGGSVMRTAVELVARFENGDEVTIPQGSYVNIDDPRTLPDRLLKEGRISEEVAAKMRERAAKTPDFVRAELTFIRRSR